jgi:hypothetical protein
LQSKISGAGSLIWGVDKSVSAFLIGISWSDPEEVAACKRVGLDEDPRCSTGIFIQAATAEDASSWGNEVAKNYLKFLFDQKKYAPETFQLFYWIEESPDQSSWKHCLEFFQKVPVGQFPDFQKMTTEAYTQWCRKVGMS